MQADIETPPPAKQQPQSEQQEEEQHTQQQQEITESRESSSPKTSPEYQEQRMEFDDLATIPLLNSDGLYADAGGGGITDADSKNKSRRYWTPREEEHFYEIWGRDNWRLTRHGKNTIYFAKWSEELKKVHNIDVKPEEVQAKVNQTRAKFRQVKKSMILEGGSTRWKKYNIIDSILKNQYRPKDAEPVPAEALENNRDMSPLPNAAQQQQQPTSINMQEQATPAAGAGGTGSGATLGGASSMTEDSANSIIGGNQVNAVTPFTAENSVSSDHNNSVGGAASYYTPTRLGYSTELFSDHYDDIKTEYDDDYRAMAYPEQSNSNQYAPSEATQLHELQTPQQLQQQQQQQQQQYVGNTQAITAAAAGTASFDAYQSDPVAGYNNAQALDYTNNNNSIPTTPSINPNTIINNARPIAQQQQRPNANHTTAQTPAPTRKRGRPINNAPPAPDSLEAIYLEEVRRKNQILDDQLQISRKRLALEERKVALMTQFFPKCLEQQAMILDKLAAAGGVARAIELPQIQQPQLQLKQDQQQPLGEPNIDTPSE